MFTFQLEKYKGIKSKYTCPNCHIPRSFVRYVTGDSNYIHETVGRCDRESKCGYHKKPKEFFAENPNFSKFTKIRAKKTKDIGKVHSQQIEQAVFDSIDLDMFIDTLGNYERNSFVQFLVSLFSDKLKAVSEVLQSYYIGTWKDKLTIFWQVDQKGRIRTGKLMNFDIKTGKRQKVGSWVENGKEHHLKVDWIHRKVRKDFKLKQCFFGEHLLKQEPEKPVAIVESEKTAVICAVLFPEMIWMAAGAKSYLTDEKLMNLVDKKILLFPDADAFSAWSEKALSAQKNGLIVRVSSLLENYTSDTEKLDGFDLADFLIAELRQKRQAETAYESMISSAHFQRWTLASLF